MERERKMYVHFFSGQCFVGMFSNHGCLCKGSQYCRDSLCSHRWSMYWSLFNIVLLSRELQQLRTDRGWLDLCKEKNKGILEIKCYKNAVDYWKMVATKLLNMKAMLSCTHEANCWPEALTKFLEITFLLNCYVTKSKM